jgi:mannose-1-phosphate guanylyltransferase/mannose-6-phosphate isomerase
LVAEQCKQINIKNPTLLLEPVGRNTAPAIAAAAMQVLKKKDKILLILSADHVIKNIEAFHDAIKNATLQAQKDRLVTFGIVPDGANTEYGYIKFCKSSDGSLNKVEEFIEKPNLNSAKSYISKDNYLWNSGIFMFKASVLIDELSFHEPKIVNIVKFSVENAESKQGFVSLDKNAFASLLPISIDYALMEKSKNLIVFSLDAGWSDIGAWNTLYEIGQKDYYGNVINGDVIVKNTSNSYINSNNRRIVSIGIDDLVIINTFDTTFVATKDEAHKIKDIIDKLQTND